jgi:peptidyl-prolyl cis-trans isomerase-like 4
MALLLETTLGDLVIDLDIEGSPEISKNVLKLAKARYYTSSLIYNIQAHRFCQLGDPQGDGTGGACIYGLIDSPDNVLQSQQRFLKSNMGRPLTEAECREKGRVVATEMNGIPDTIGSQLLITISEGQDMALDRFTMSSTTNNTAAEASSSDAPRQTFRSVGFVREDENNLLDQIEATYCDSDGRPYADIRVIRALIIDDPFEDPPGMDRLLKERGVVLLDENDNDKVTASPEYERPTEETVEKRIPADQVDPLIGEEDIEKMREQEEELLKREDKSRAVVLEMLGDLPDAEIKAPENVLFVCKLNPITEDEDLELIFSRFDEKVKVEIIRDPESGNSLQYAFIEFTTKEQSVEAYFKMDNALVDDRRIKVDFSQSVAKVWNKYTQRMNNSATGKRSNQGMPKDPFSDRNTSTNNRAPRNSRAPMGNGHPGRGRGRDGHPGRGGGRDHIRDWPRRDGGNGQEGNRREPRHDHRGPPRGHGVQDQPKTHSELDQFGRERTWGKHPSHRHNRHERGEDHGRSKQPMDRGKHASPRHNRNEREEDQGRSKQPMDRKKEDHDHSKKTRRHDSDDDSRDRSRSPRDHRRRHGSRSRDERESKYRKDHKQSKSKREHKEHRTHRSPDRHDDWDSSPRRHKHRDDGSEDRHRERKHDKVSSRRHETNEKPDGRTGRDRRGHSRDRSEERRRDGDRRDVKSHKPSLDEEKRHHEHGHRDRSKRHRSRSRSITEDDEVRRRKRDRDDSRRRHRGHGDDYRSHDHGKRHLDDSDERKDKGRRDEKEDRKRHRKKSS